MLSAYYMDNETNDALVSVCIGLRSIRRVEKVFNYRINSGFDPDEYLGNRFLLMQVKYGMMIDAHGLFDEMLIKNILSWNTIVRGLVDVGDYFGALCLFLMMWRIFFFFLMFLMMWQIFFFFFDAESQMFVTMIQASVGLGLIFAGRQTYSCSLKTSICGDVFMACALIDLYIKCGSIEDAQCVFDHMLEKPTCFLYLLIFMHALNNGFSKILFSNHFNFIYLFIYLFIFSFSFFIVNKSNF
ncbi:hypothetical protein VitviT2T_028422 [Vitis vinifera]|uniref:Pentatricopeptide repeat-containing protein n=1 Tax=Vitis vinifera TaxID=29760 RepID=A0ABY9DVC6_VITVI|nr:hypothetical protein VitviT2T_028422 [Vitis vinifera]